MEKNAMHYLIGDRRGFLRLRRISLWLITPRIPKFAGQECPAYPRDGRLTPRNGKVLGVLGCLIVAGVLALAGCASDPEVVEKYPYAEPTWVREGEPIVVEGESWCPQSVIEHFTDNEVVPIAKYKDQQIFVERREVKPYERLYMKIDSLTFRVFKKREKEE